MNTTRTRVLAASVAQCVREASPAALRAAASDRTRPMGLRLLCAMELARR